MSGHGRLFLKKDPQTSYLIEERELLIGRSKNCDISIEDAFISRHQARFYFDNGQYILENIGNNPVLINGQQAQKHILKSNDEITFGKTEFLFKLESAPLPSADATPEETTGEERTVFMQSPLPVDQGPRLVVTFPNGKDAVYPIKGSQIIIGRSADADIRLEDLSVSRRHCAIEKERQGYVARSLTYTNPVIVNDHPVDEKSLTTGDQLKFGPYVATFLSDRAVDKVPHTDVKIALRRGGVPSAVLGVAALVLMVTVGYFVYRQMHTSPNTAADLKTVAQKLNEGDLGEAQKMLTRLLAANLSTKEHEEAMELFRQAVLLQGQNLASVGNTREAKNLLADYIDKYGAGAESKAVRDGLDSYRFQSGQELEIAGDLLGAVKEFSGISDGSPYHEQAQKALSRIWLSYRQKQNNALPQKESPQQPPLLPALLAQAEEHFQAKRYTTPLNNNAYAIYKTIMDLDPNNSVATARIDQMKAFYLEHGEKYYRARNYVAALSYLERYLLINPEDPSVKERVAACRKALGRNGLP